MSTVPVTASAFRRPGPRGPGTGDINWTMVSVLVVILAHVIGVTAWAARAESRLTHIEADNPAGVLARIDERTTSIDKRLERIESLQDVKGVRP